MLTYVARFVTGPAAIVLLAGGAWFALPTAIERAGPIGSAVVAAAVTMLAQSIWGWTFRTDARPPGKSVTPASRS